MSDVMGPQPKANIYKPSSAGTVGHTKGETSTGGGQQPHLPSPDSFKGGFHPSKGAGSSSGTTSSKRSNPILPEGNPHGKGKP